MADCCGLVGWVGGWVGGLLLWVGWLVGSWFVWVGWLVGSWFVWVGWLGRWLGWWLVVGLYRLVVGAPVSYFCRLSGAMLPLVPKKSANYFRMNLMLSGYNFFFEK